MSRILLAASMLLATQLVCAAEGGTTLKADTLRAEPYQDAQAVTALDKGARVDILATQGGWLRVASGKRSGWIRMLSVRRDAARNTAGTASPLAALAAGRAGTGRIVATTGIRGLNEEELKTARYDEAQITQMESYASSQAAAQQFARNGKLAAQRVDYLNAGGSAK